MPVPRASTRRMSRSRRTPARNWAYPAAKLVVRWGMFPTQQEFLPGDYNWGMTAYGLPPGAVFDLEVNWKEADMQHSGEIGGVLCAPDVDKLK